MQLIVEIDGVFFDVRPAFWEAYSKAVAGVGMARTEEATLWRLVRTAGADGLMMRGARPHQLDKFRQAFNAALEADEVIDKYIPHDDCRDGLRVVHDLGPFTSVTCGANLAARHRLLRANALAEAFPQLGQVPAPASAAAAALRPIAARRADEKLVVVLAATVELVAGAEEAGMVSIGITSGPATGKRLAAAGARATYSDLAAFSAALANQEEPLRRAGLVF